MKTSAADGALVEIPLTGDSSKASADMPIIVHREFHDETNMKRISTSQAFRQVHNVRVKKTQGFM